MTNLEVMTPRHEWSVRELIEANLDELCRFCFNDETIARIYKKPTLIERLSKAYAQLASSADEEFKAFELPIPGYGWEMSGEYRELIKNDREGEQL